MVEYKSEQDSIKNTAHERISPRRCKMISNNLVIFPTIYCNFISIDSIFITSSKNSIQSIKRLNICKVYKISQYGKPQSLNIHSNQIPF